MENAVTARIRVILANSMYDISPELRVSCVFSVFARAWDKFFSLSANYPKGQGEHFVLWLKTNRPGVHHCIMSRALKVQDMIFT